MSSEQQDRQPGWVRRLTSYLLRHRTDLYLSFGAAALGTLCTVLLPLIERQIIDNVIITHSSALWPWLTLLIVASTAIFGFSYIRRYRGGQVALAVQYDLRNDMQAHLQSLDFENLGRMPTGQLVSRANSDSALVQGLLMFLPIMSGNVLLLVLSLIVMFVLSPLLALVSLVIAPALVVVSYRMRWKVFPATWDGQQREGDVAQIVDEDINGVRVVKAFGQEDHELGRVVEASRLLYSSQLRAVRLQSKYQPILQAIPSLGQVAILALGGWLALHRDITLGTFLAFSTYVAQMAAPTRQLAGLLTVGQQARAGIERIFQLLDLPSEVVDAPHAVDLPDVNDLPAGGGDIRFRNVTFAYGRGDDQGATVLDGFDLHISPGERVAIVGASGSGKSSAAMLIPRFYEPVAGSIEVDGIDVNQLRLASLRSHIGLAFEESFLFSDSIRANISYGNPSASEAEIRAAAEAAQASEFIEALSDGWETVVGERGLTLSGGQRQRIALARAILRDPRILILDDATSAIDVATEELIHHALRDAMAGRTTLLIAHRRSTLHLADRIVVMEAGRIVEDGTHEELTERSALFRSLLSGLDDEAAAQIGDSVEALSSIADARRSTDGAVTAAAWNSGSATSGGRTFAARSIGAASIGAGLGGGGGGWRLNLAPTPELLERVAALPPVRDEAIVDLQSETVADPQFSLLRLLRAFRGPLLVGLMLVVLDSVAALFGPVLTKTGIDSGVNVGSEATLFTASGIYLFITAADFFVEVGQTFVTGRAAQRIMLSLRIRIFAQLQRLSLDYYEREMAGRIMTRMTTDVDQFESLVENGLLSALVAIVTFAGVGAALIIFNWRLALVTLSVVMPLAFATVAFRRRAAALYEQARERIAIVNADFQESLSGVRESQAFVHEAATIERFHSLGRDYLDSRVKAQRLVATYFPFVQFLSAVADAIALGVGAGLIASGHLTSGALIAFILYIDLFFSPIQQLSQVFDAWQQTRVSVNRITQLMQQQTLTPNQAGAERLDMMSGEVKFDHARFAYPILSARPGIDDPAERRGPADAASVGATTARPAPPEALRGIDLQIAPGETVALVGETGAGKSTVMKLLARFYDPDTGSVKVDDHDLRSLDLLDFRHRLGYVPQESFLFTGSLRDNIAYGRPEASDAAVEAAARAVGAHEFIAALPDGYHTGLSERGRSMSAGQRQLIALARAQLVDPGLLLLDEATSNLDLATEAHVNAAMQQVALGRTTIVIAHRLQTARQADRIAVLDHGRVAEIGSHDELLAAGGRYAAMWDAFESVNSTAAV